MNPGDLTDRQKQVLEHVARRLRRQANQLENLIRSGDAKKLAHACGMLHATETQLLWLRNETQPGTVQIR